MKREFEQVSSYLWFWFSILRLFLHDYEIISRYIEIQRHYLEKVLFFSGSWGNETGLRAVILENFNFLSSGPGPRFTELLLYRAELFAFLYNCTILPGLHVRWEQRSKGKELLNTHPLTAPTLKSTCITRTLCKCVAMMHEERENSDLCCHHLLSRFNKSAAAALLTQPGL